MESYPDRGSPFNIGRRAAAILPITVAEMPGRRFAGQAACVQIMYFASDSSKL
jgi:hypothetical protein